MSPSFFGHIASSVSGSIFHCDSTPDLICLCTDVLTGVCPAMSVDGENLGSNNNQAIRHLWDEGGLNLLFEHVAGQFAHTGLTRIR